MTAPGAAPRTLTRHPEPLAVARLGPGADVPDWATGSTLLSVTATAAETSVVCSASAVPARVRHAGPFTAFVVDGTLDFALTGVLAGLTVPLAEAGIPVFVISTFDTDWVLVPADDADAAAEAWRAHGLVVASAGAAAGVPAGEQEQP